jgi:hypothetical protein
MDNPIQHINAKVVSAERQEADGMVSFLVRLFYNLIVNGSNVLCSTQRCLSFPLQENPRWRRAKRFAIDEARHELDRYFPVTRMKGKHRIFLQTSFTQAQSHAWNCHPG